MGAEGERRLADDLRSAGLHVSIDRGSRRRGSLYADLVVDCPSGEGFVVEEKDVSLARLEGWFAKTEKRGLLRGRKPLLVLSRPSLVVLKLQDLIELLRR